VEDLVPLARGLRASGMDVDDVLAELRSRGATVVESLKVVREVEHLTLGEAKIVVDESRAWADHRSSKDALRAEATGAFGESEEGRVIAHYSSRLQPSDVEALLDRAARASVRIGVLGRIVAGDDTGRFVEVLDDASLSGGFLILTYDNVDRSGNAFDSWVESITDVDLYFDECGWEVEWLD